ncbi:putative PurR-regulated permease PerM [Myroides gitamensis]|uniref:hypothetical protein n=1 Tax=Myroides odoratus TaxID=256 RepID=UPI00216AA756|nr:hypothetical protein [Myroides odoratus]MCS4240166.1 putative PurR-regulated permease PerM [Myroides odoratus]MDH6601083.1 putative PurR-regulated permease PerM [Myroides gitamensis]
MAKNQPKLSDMTELLLLQVIQLEQTIKQSEKAHLETIRELSNIKVTVNVAEIRQIKKDNEELLKVHKTISSKRLFYLIVLNNFLILTTCFYMYVVVKNTIDNSQY